MSVSTALTIRLFHLLMRRHSLELYAASVAACTRHTERTLFFLPANLKTQLRQRNSAYRIIAGGRGGNGGTKGELSLCEIGTKQGNFGVM